MFYGVRFRPSVFNYRLVQSLCSTGRVKKVRTRSEKEKCFRKKKNLLNPASYNDRDLYPLTIKQTNVKDRYTNKFGFCQIFLGAIQVCSKFHFPIKEQHETFRVSESRLASRLLHFVTFC